MSKNRVWIYAAVLFLLVGTILTTQVSWLFKSAEMEESFLNQRVNMALCSAMDVLSKDRGICSNVEKCVSHGAGRFEIAFTKQQKARIDSVIQRHLSFYNIHVPFHSTLSPFTADSASPPLALSQALLYPPSAGIQNVVVQIEIPSKSQLIRSQINSTFILSLAVLVALIWIFVNTVRALIRENRIRKKTVDFINIIAHDLKTPISNISFATALLGRDQVSSGLEKNPFVSIIEAETRTLKDRARKILGRASVDDVLDDSVDMEGIDVHKLLLESVASFSARLKETNGNVRMQLDASHVLVRGNRLQLSSAIVNIIDNAITYSKDVVIIEIRTSNRGNVIRMEIIDNGPGIPAYEQELVFRKAYRIRRGAPLSEGFGLGLYLAKTSVEKNRGRLSLASDGYSGSCFTIELPLTGS